MAKVTMPQLGESVAEGTIGRWLKKPGDRVEKYEPIVEVITDKVNAEVPSPFAGTLTAILVEEGATVPNETPIAEIETGRGRRRGRPHRRAAPRPRPPPSRPPLHPRLRRPPASRSPPRRLPAVPRPPPSQRPRPRPPWPCPPSPTPTPG